MNLEQLLPAQIEKRSFEIITEELREKSTFLKASSWSAEQELVVKRVIHTTADFDYADNLIFSEQAIESGLRALRQGATIITDTNMVKAGINKTVLTSFGGKVECFMSDPEVAEKAKREQRTRAAVSMEHAASLGEDCIFAVGNAPTALIQLYHMIQEEQIKPKLIIAVPVGFVNVVQSKELMLSLALPTIVAKGRKGGSNVAAAICNALLYQL